MTAVIGLDLSLTSTGIATPTHTKVIRPKKLAGVDRIRWIADQIAAYAVNVYPVATVAVEGPSYGSVGPGQHERGGLWWFVVELLDSHGYPVVVVPPATLKKYACGKGTASKDEMMLAASRRWAGFTGGNDEADAWFLSLIAAELAGQPVVEMPQAHRRDLASKVTWVRQPVIA